MEKNAYCKMKNFPSMSRANIGLELARQQPSTEDAKLSQIGQNVTVGSPSGVRAKL